MIPAQISWERRRLAGVSGTVCDTPARRRQLEMSKVQTPVRRRRSLGIPFVLLTLFAIGSFSALADSFTSGFDGANKLYEQAKYADAAAVYEKLIQTGRASEALYFNWGNALFKSGKIGRAIAAYQEAQRIDPRDPDVRANLQFARNQVPGPTLPPDRLSRWLENLTLNEWTCLAAGSSWIWLCLLALLKWRRDLRAALKSFVVWLGWIAAALAVCLAMAFYSTQIVHHAIIVNPETTARQAPLDESQRAFTLNDGAELQILDQKDQWLQVKVDPRRIGWVRKVDALISPGT